MSSTSYAAPPSLLELGTTEHLRNSLAECRQRRHSYVSTVVNIILIVLFCGVSWTIYKYKSKTPDKSETDFKKAKIAEGELMSMLQRSGSRIAIQNNMPSW